MTPHQVQVAGESYAASLFAQAGCDVLIQYGPNQPDYDLVAVLGENAIPISVKATQLAGWGLIQSYKNSTRSYADAAEAWFCAQKVNSLFCLICFCNVAVGATPYSYLASPRDIANHHKSGKKGTGTTTIYMDYTPTRGLGKGFRHQIPEEWKFTQERVDSFFNTLCTQEDP